MSQMWVWGHCEKLPLLEFSVVDGQEVASEKDWLCLSQGWAHAMGTTGQGLRRLEHKMAGPCLPLEGISSDLELDLLGLVNSGKIKDTTKKLA